MKYEAFFRKHLDLIEEKLRGILKTREARPLKIHKAMQYSVFTGGKRFRPVLALAACEACGGRAQDALIPACAVELIHTSSLVHDDLPALDNDDLRRGKPSCHKKFDEATAILVGDSFLILAFEILSEIKPAARITGILKEIAAASGVRGMIGGQVEDLEVSSKPKTLDEHDFISINKTGQLIRVSAVAGALAAGASSKEVGAMARYGECLGLAFQVVDDILDGDGYCKIMSKAQATQKAGILIDIAKREAERFGRRAKGLIFLADFLKARIPNKK